MANVSSLTKVQLGRARLNLGMSGASDDDVRDALRAAIRDGYKLKDFDVFNAKLYPAKIFKQRNRMATKKKSKRRNSAKHRKNPKQKAKKRKRSSSVNRLKNPKPVGLFRTKAAARKYAKEHARPGVKFSVKKIKRGK